MVGGEWGQGKWKLSANLQLEDRYTHLRQINIQVVVFCCFVFKNNVTGNNWLLVITQSWYLLHDETEIVAGM